MFESEYVFKGSHAKKVKKLTSPAIGEFRIFNRNMDVFLLAPIVGFLYNIKSVENNIDKENTKIFSDVMIKEKTNNEFNYKLIMLSDKEFEPDFNKRLDLAFRYYNKPSEDSLKLFNQYILGGVDVIYENILGNACDDNMIIKNLYNFIDSVKEKYRLDESNDFINNLINLAKTKAFDNGGENGFKRS